MGDSKSSENSSYSRQFRFVDLKLPALYDQKINTQLQEKHYKHDRLVLRQPLLVSMSHILKPATTFLDSLLQENVPENGDEIVTSNHREFNSTLSKVNAFLGDRCLHIPTLLERVLANGEFTKGAYDRLDLSTISELNMFAGHRYFMIPTRKMEDIANRAVQKLDESNCHMMLMYTLEFLQSLLSCKILFTSPNSDETGNHDLQTLDEIDLHMVSMDMLEFLRPLSWDAKAGNTMGCFVFKFLELLGFLLGVPNQSLSKIASSMVENSVSIMGSTLEKFQEPLVQLNTLIKLALEVIERISDLTLLSDTKSSKEDLLLTSVRWAILSVVACYIQTTLI